MTTKHEVIAVYRAHPEWTTRQIADHLGCLREYVTATARRNGFKPASHVAKQRERVFAGISDSARTVLLEAAIARGLSVHELVERIIDQVAADQIVDAILDDEVAA